MHRLKLIPIIILYFPNIFVRFFRGLLKKTYVPNIIIDNEKFNQADFYEGDKSIRIIIKNGFILKINKTYLPITKDYVELKLNNINNQKIVELKLIGIFKVARLKKNTTNKKNAYINKIPFNKSNLLTNRLRLKNSNFNLKHSKTYIKSDLVNQIPISTILKLNTKRVSLANNTIEINGFKEEKIKEELELIRNHIN